MPGRSSHNALVSGAAASHGDSPDADTGADPATRAPGPAEPPDSAAPAESGTRPLRADARDNRERILAAARAAYMVHGIDVPVAAIARRAGVGVATVYRRFPTRDALVAAAFAEQLDHCVGILHEALEDPDPWRGFCSVIERVCAMQVADRGFTAAFLSRFPHNAGFEHERDRAEEALARLVQRAKETGRLRTDFRPDDIVLLLLANNGVAGESPEVAAAASRRLVAYLLQSLRAETAAPLPPPAPMGLDRIPGSAPHT
ncbi:TetR/AcrR family transcriptional regulator [Streptomonospora sediminis]